MNVVCIVWLQASSTEGVGPEAITLVDPGWGEDLEPSSAPSKASSSKNRLNSSSSSEGRKVRVSLSTYTYQWSTAVVSVPLLYA